MNCLKLFQKALRRTPHKPAITQIISNKEVCCLTYNELAHELERVQTALLAQGLKAGDSVPILAVSKPQVLVTIMACISLDLCAVPVDPMSPKQEFDTLLGDNKSSNNCHNSILLIHSSGSTGSPKKIHYSSDRLQAFMRRHDYFYRQYSDLKEKQVFSSDLICTIPLHHLAGIAFCLQGLMMGRTVHLLRNFTAEEYFTLAVKKSVSLLILVPSMLESILSNEDLLKQKHRVKHCVVIGEPCSASTYQDIETKLGAQALVAYGLSECEVGIGHHNSVINANKVAMGSCGKLLFGEAKLIQQKTGKEDESFGELWVRNDTTFACYGDSEQNKARFSDGWFRTGDLLRRDDEGNYYHCGRVDSMFSVNGKSIYPQEVENIFNDHPAIANALVFPLESVTGKTLLGAMLKIDPEYSSRAPTKGEFIEYYLKKGSYYSVPGWIMLVHELPSNAIGKIDRLNCEQSLQHDYQSHVLKVAS